MAVEEPASKGAFEFETHCVHHLAEENYSLTVRNEVSRKMASLGVNLTDVHHVMKQGKVIYSGMRDRGSLWVVRGRLVDGGRLDVTLTFNLSELHVELIDLA
jgi:hypothetical protein